MKKAIKTVIIILASVIVICAAVFVAIYFTRFQSVATIKKITDYDDGFDIYTMEVKYDYDTEGIIRKGFTDTQSFLDTVLKSALPLLPVHISLPSYGCSTYRALTEDGDTIMGRNYDFKIDTSCMVCYCAPKDGYRSVSFAALSNIGANDAESGLKTKIACILAPLCILDGVNEKGVSVAILTVDSDPTDQNSGKEKITHSLACRLILDYAATTEEAIRIIEKYDMYALNGRDYHLFISDASGNSCTVEYDPESEERTLSVTPIQAVTNFYAMYIDKVVSHQRNGIYGHGKERYDYMMEIIDANDGILSDEDAWNALKAASTEPNPESLTSNTQWSIIFNNTDATADIVLRRNWNDIFSFACSPETFQ